MASAARASGPKTQKGRTATVRPLTKLLRSNIVADTMIEGRIQRLQAVGVFGARAKMIAEIAWGMPS